MNTAFMLATARCGSLIFVDPNDVHAAPSSLIVALAAWNADCPTYYNGGDAIHEARAIIRREAIKRGLAEHVSRLVVASRNVPNN